jgi:hypothetical protein
MASWIVIHLLNYVHGAGDWLISVFEVCWLTLFVLALAAPFLRQGSQFAIYSLILAITFGAFQLILLAPEKGVVLPNRWLQEAGFRVYALHLVRSTPLQELLSKCKLVDYGEEGVAKRQVGECSDDLRSTIWFRIVMVYDPSGQLALPAVERTLAWRLAVLRLPNGRFFVHDSVATHLDGNFYWILAPPDLSGDDGR